MTKPQLTAKDIEAAFYMQPERVVEFFKSKGLETSYDWHDVYNEAHAKAFTVAKMTELDLLKDTQKLLAKSLEEGTTYQQFKKEAMELFERKGWTGFKEVVNPKTGEKETVELGTPRRIRTIYINNINSAYAAGKYKELLEEVDVAPYWMYQCMMDGHERPEHHVLHGKVYKADDHFWSVFFPPNGWGCRCWVVSLTKRQLEKMGRSVETTTSNDISFVKDSVGGKDIEIPVYKFEDVGKTYHLKPDAGWGSNIGAHAWGIDVQAWNKVQDLPDKVKFDFISKMAENPHRKADYISWASKILNTGLKNTELEKTLSWITPELYKRIIKDNITIQSPVVVITNSQVGHSGVNKLEKQALSNEEYLQVYDIVQNPDEIYYDYTRPKWVQLVFVRMLPGYKNCIKVCIRLNQTSRIKNNNDLISKVTTIGKVPIDSFNNGKYKKIE